MAGKSKLKSKLEQVSSVNQTIRKCTYVLTPATIGAPAVYCNKYTDWKIVLDQENNRVRHYNIFCNHHLLANLFDSLAGE